MYDELLKLWEITKGPLNDEIKQYVLDIKIRELIAKIPLRQQLTSEYKLFEKLDEIKVNDIYHKYKEVIPCISSYEKVPHPSITKHIEKF